MALIKSNQDIAHLRIAGQKLASILRQAAKLASKDLLLTDLEQQIQQWILAADATPSFLGYEGYPAASCLSLNDQVVHGIPDKRKLQDGDILGIDIGLWYKKVCVDAALTVPIGTVAPELETLLTVTKKALTAGIKAAKPFRRVGAISQAIQEVAEEADLGIVRSLTGHGVGHQVHESPEVPNLGKASDGIILKPGMVLAIEPMFTLGEGEVLTEVDGWGIVTADHSFSAHFEHTVLITQKGAEILTISKSVA